MKARIVLITGANRGLGFGTAQYLLEEGYSVILTSREEQEGKQIAERLKSDGFDVDYHQLDVTRVDQIQNLVQSVGDIDILINNAGVLIDPTEDLSLQEQKRLFMQTLEVNVVGAYLMCQAFIPGMLKKGYGRVVNVSSSAGQLNDAVYFKPMYGISKTALNGMTVQLANQYRDTGVLINSISPGWVNTRMGGPNAPREVKEGVEGIIWAATLPEGGPTGGFFKDGKPLNW